MIKLSICIATYNRCEFIGKTLDSLIPQMTIEVEIIVVDGASLDKTAEVIHSFQSRCERIRYVRLPEKGGVDKDFDLAVKFAEGEYCWLFTDDDLAKPGAIKEILKQTEELHDLIILNAEVRSPDLSQLLEENRLRIMVNKIYSPQEFERFFVENAFFMSFIGCVVIRRNVWMSRNRKEYFGSEFIHLGVIFQKCFESPISVIASPLIAIRFGNAHWTNRTFNVWVFQWSKIIWSFGLFSEKAKQLISPREPWRNLRFLVSLRAKGYFGKKEYIQFIKPKISSFWENVIIRSLVFVPGCIFNLLALVYNFLKLPIDHFQFFVLKNSKYYFFDVRKIFLGNNHPGE